MNAQKDLAGTGWNKLRRTAAALLVCSALVVSTLGLGGCGADEAGASFAPGSWQDNDWNQSADSSKSYDGSNGAAMDAALGGADLPPEKEQPEDYGAPEGTGSYVYIPSTSNDQVVRISGQSLQVRLTEVGSQPIVLAVVPAEDAAVVLNAGSDDVSIIRSTEAGDEVTTVPVLPHCNRLLVAPNGQFALAWYDIARQKTNDIPGSLQAVSLIRLAKGSESSATVSTGYQVGDVRFDDAGKQALVVTRDGLSVVTLATAQDGDIAVPVPLGPNLPAGVEREVQTTSDGQWAVVRDGNAAELRLVHVVSGLQARTLLPTTPTDLDLVPGKNQAVAVLRESGQVALVSLPTAATEGTVDAQLADMGGLTAGLARLTSDGQTALLYTSIGGVEEVGVLDLLTGSVQRVAVRKVVDNVVILPGSRKALLLHRPAQGPGYSDPAEQLVDDAEGYSVLDLDSGFAKLVLTPVRPGEIAGSGLSGDNSAKAWLLLPGGTSHAVQSLGLKNLLTKDHELGSKPKYIRWLPQAGVLAVIQEHPSGRVTFLNAETGAAKTVTGFQLGGLLQ